MKGKFKFKGGVDGDTQMSDFMNATLTTLGDDEQSISIAITPRFPAGFPISDRKAVKEHVRQTVQPLIEAGWDVEVQHGPF